MDLSAPQGTTRYKLIDFDSAARLNGKEINEFRKCVPILPSLRALQTKKENNMFATCCRYSSAYAPPEGMRAIMKISEVHNTATLATTCTHQTTASDDPSWFAASAVSSCR